MSRSTSFIGLPVPAESFLAALVCKKVDKLPITTDMTGMVDYYGGIFESKEVYDKDIRTFKEVFQFEMWDSGPEIYTMLVEINGDRTERVLFQWNENEVLGRYDDSVYHPSIFVHELTKPMTVGVVKEVTELVLKHFSGEYIGKCFMVQNETLYYLGTWTNDITYQYTMGTDEVRYFGSAFIQLKTGEVSYEPRMNRTGVLYSQFLGSIQDILIELRQTLVQIAKEELLKGVC